MGEIGIGRDTFLYELRLWEILGIIRGYRRRELMQWKVARWQTYWVLCAMGAGEKISSPNDLLELPGDDDQPDIEISEDEYQASLELIRQANAKKTPD